MRIAAAAALHCWDADRLVRALAPALPPDVSARIIERSAGTPLLIEELAGLADGSAEFPERPDIVRVTVQGRAARLGPATRDMLDIAAVPERGSRLAEQGLEAARRSEDAYAAWWASHHRIHLAYRRSGDGQAATSAFLENAAAARALGITDGEALTMWDLACHTAAGQYIETGLEAAERAGAQTGARAGTNDLQVLKAAMLLLEGHPDAAESLLVRFGHQIRIGEPVIAPWIAVSEALLYLHRGDLAAARRALHGPVSATEASRTEYHVADRAAALGWLAWEEGRLADAVGHLDRSARLRHTGCWHTLVGGPVFLPLHVDALCRLGRPAEASAAIRRSEGAGQQDRFFAAALAMARFRIEPTRELAVGAESVSKSAPWPWLSALCGIWRGEFLGDDAAAAAAAEAFEEIGAPRGARAAKRILRGRGVLPVVPAGTADPLSEREMQVARLVADGLSNPAIAARLYLSRPTVANHVTRILAKLGCSSRAQVAAWVAAQLAAEGSATPQPRPDHPAGLSLPDLALSRARAAVRDRSPRACDQAGPTA